MPILAGQTVLASVLNRLQPKRYIAAATSNLVRNNVTTVADIPGATITVDTETANATYTVYATFDVQIGATAAGNMLGYLMVDGATDSAQAARRMDAVTRDTITQVWQGTLPAAGSHTFKLQGQSSAASASVGTLFTSGSTKIQLEITEVV
ncbi:hypothetical protein [Streptomyces lavendulocolor]|uniref:hypothetical protein n=1 Tax=Streptomyces lavendulocolor TaxID=67316 RepID=UPI003C2EFBB7